jgi:hypothetical protein
MLDPLAVKSSPNAEYLQTKFFPSVDPAVPRLLLSISSIDC